MSERKEYETFLPWRVVVAALHYATSSIHLENATSPEKETNLCMLYQHFMPCLCSIRISSRTSTIFGKECICRTSFSFSLCSHFFWHTILTCFRTEINEVSSAIHFLSFFTHKVTQQYSSQQISNSTAGRTGFTSWFGCGLTWCNLEKGIKETFPVAYFLKRFYFIKWILMILISYSNDSFFQDHNVFYCIML